MTKHNRNVSGLRLNKKGVIQFLVVISFLVVAGSISAGTYLINHNPSDFVGNVNLKLYYSNECLPKVPEQNRIIFPNKEIAETLNFTYSEC